MKSEIHSTGKVVNSQSAIMRGKLCAVFGFSMRRFLVVVSLALSCAACSRAVPNVPDLSAEEVLQRAAVSVRSLQTANYEISGSFTAESKSNDSVSGAGTFALKGTLENGGDSVQSGLNADIRIGNSFLGGVKLRGAVETIIAKDGASYVYLYSLTTDPPNILINDQIISALSGRWLQLPQQETESSGTPSPPIAPDPLMLKEQAKLVSITRKYRPTFIDDVAVYHYGVELNKEEFITLLRERSEKQNVFFDEESVRGFLQSFTSRGEMWIDAQTFYVRAIAWDVNWNDVYNVQASFSMNLRNHNRAAPIQYPTDAVPFSPIELLDRSVLPQAQQNTTSDLPPDFESQLMNELLNDDL